MAKSNQGLNRRAFLGSAALSAVPLVMAQGAQPAQRERVAFPGLIVRQREPENLEFPFSSLSSFQTPTEQFFVRSHFPVPEVDAKSWRLRVEGNVAKPFEIGYEELRRLPSRTGAALLECAGNSRILLRAPQLGLRWDQGAVGHAEWTGVPLAALLERAGVRDGAVEVILEGADRGEYRDPVPRSPGVISFARSLPLAKARQPEVLLAYQMNGKDLTRAHGYPLRAVVPGWYGMASVKWLTRIRVVEQPYHGYHQTFSYTIWDRQRDFPTLIPVTEMQIKAQIARPTHGEVVPVGSKYTIFGAAWAGESEVAKVEISTDNGKRWADARLLQKPTRYAWSFFEYIWQTPNQPGTHTLMARATDSRGRVQPMERNEDFRDAMISHVQRIRVEVA